MEIYSFINRLKNKYPLMEDIDLYKAIFQACFLNGHALSEQAVSNLYFELENTNKENTLIYEYLDDDCVRVNLDGFCFDKKEFCEQFLASGSVTINKPFKKILEEYKLSDLSIIPSHSRKYKDNYHPNYRLLHTQYLPFSYRVKKLQDFIDSISSKDEVKVVCLDGRCGSGKSSLANKLNNCTIIHCDNHFKDPLDFEMIKKVITSLKLKQYTIEKCYDCKNKTYWEKELKPSDVIVCEGSFSYSEELRDQYDYLVFTVVNKKIQRKRLESRESKKSFLKYLDVWIPREEEYYQSFNFIEKADILI